MENFTHFKTRKFGSMIALAALVGVATAGDAGAQQRTPTADVTVVNPSDAPVPVAPGGTPVVASANRSCGSSQCSVTVFDVPQEKLLIIEFVSTRADGLDDDDAFQWMIRVMQNGQVHDFELGLLEKQPPIGANSQHSGGKEVRIIAGAGNVSVFVSYGNFGDIDFMLSSISGWLIDAP